MEVPHYDLNDIVEMKKEHPCHKSKQWRIIRMGADIRVEGRVAVVYGVPRLHGAQVRATDLRGGAALAVAALGAEGRSELTGVHHIDRGYQSLEGLLESIGLDRDKVCTYCWNGRE